MNIKELNDYRKKILKGLELSFQRLLEQKQKDDEVLVFSRNGKVEVIQAREFAITTKKKISIRGKK